MDYLRNVALFRRTIELGSISAAGRDMRMSAGRALSGIVELENRLGARLLYRSTRHLAPTEHGNLFYRESGKILDRTWQAEQNVNARLGAVQRSLRISSPSQFNRDILGPVIPEFRDLNPEIDIQLISCKTAKSNSDLIFSYETPITKDHVLHTSFECPAALVASSQYIDRHGLPTSVTDINTSSHKCLVFEDSEILPAEWQFRNGQEIVTLQPRACLRSNDEAVITDWALEGLGIAQKLIFEVNSHLRERRLHVVLDRTPLLPIKLWVTYRERYRSDPKVNQLLGLIVNRFRAAFMI